MQTCTVQWKLILQAVGLLLARHSCICVSTNCSCSCSRSQIGSLTNLTSYVARKGKQRQAKLCHVLGCARGRIRQFQDISTEEWNLPNSASASPPTHSHFRDPSSFTLFQTLYKLDDPGPWFWSLPFVFCVLSSYIFNDLPSISQTSDELDAVQLEISLLMKKRKCK